MKLTSVENSHWLDKATSLLEQDILGVKLGIYGIGLLGLGIALKRVRPFKKLILPNDIPKSFIDENINLSGKIVGIEFFPRTLLAIDHHPLLGARLRRTGRLPVKLEGINITGNGISWIQNIVIGKNVDFIILEKHQDYLSCLVKDGKRDIGDYLVTIGFASVAPFNNKLEKNEMYKAYYKGLLKAENIAERKYNGMWWDRPRRFSLLDFLKLKVPILKLKTVLSRS